MIATAVAGRTNQQTTAIARIGIRNRKGNWRWAWDNPETSAWGRTSWMTGIRHKRAAEIASTQRARFASVKAIPHSAATGGRRGSRDPGKLLWETAKKTKPHANHAAKNCSLGSLYRQKRSARAGVQGNSAAASTGT